MVGVDGSAGSVAALRWALAEAQARGAPLRIVHAYEVPRLPADEFDRLRAASEAQARRVVDSTLEQAESAAKDGVDIQRDVIEGPATPVLIEAGRGAALLVLGSHGRGRFAGLLLGSVSQQCAQHPPYPVVILPPVEEESSGNG